MPREVVSLHIGQAGIQLGASQWELFCKEHNINPDGTCDTNNDQSFTTFFQHTPSGQYVPRAMFVDLETSVTDEVKRGPFKNLFAPSSFLTGKEDASNNFARGRLDSNNELLLETVDGIRKIFEECSNLQSVIVSRSCAGGTGSGYTTALMENLYDCLKKKVKFGIDIYPSQRISTSMVEPYNTIFGAASSHPLLDLNVPIDNEAIYDICTRQLDIKSPSYANLNRVVSQLMSSITLSCRFPGALNVDMNEFVTNLVPFRNAHYLISGFAPISSKSKSSHENITCQLITTSCLSQANRFVKCDIMKGVNSGCMFMYRGDIGNKDVEVVLEKLSKDQRNFPRTAEHTPSAFKIGLNSQPFTTVDEKFMSSCKKAVTLLMNNNSIVELWKNLMNKFVVMQSKRAFIHWYIGEGMDEGEMPNYLNTINSIIEEYQV